MAQQIGTLRRIEKKSKRTKSVAEMAHAMAVHYNTEAQSLPSANSNSLISKTSGHDWLRSRLIQQVHHSDAAGHQHRTLYPHAYDTLQACYQPPQRESYQQDGSPGSPCFLLHMEVVELLGAAHLMLLADLLDSIPLQAEQAVAQQVGLPLGHKSIQTRSPVLMKAGSVVSSMQ